ncbi:hypothetical protein Nmel_016137, partial [Mimus melanotis]
ALEVLGSPLLPRQQAQARGFPLVPLYSLHPFKLRPPPAEPKSTKALRSRPVTTRGVVGSPSYPVSARPSVLHSAAQNPPQLTCPDPSSWGPLSRGCPLCSWGALSPRVPVSARRRPGAMAEPRFLQAECAFRPGAHTVRVTLTRSTLRVEVEAHGTADLWRGEFDATFIEDLTRKTGNFKQFGIFCSMLESALTQSSDSVSLELLTYTDLETLHSRKVGAITRPPPSTRSPLNTKRYLILVYSVEFDR